MTEGGMVYKDQSAFGLRHTLIEGAVGLENFHLLKSQSNNAGNLTVHLHIIGASHVAYFSWPDFCLTEIFACMEASHLGKVIRTGQQNAGGMRAAIKIDFSGKSRDSIEYIFNSYHTNRGAEDVMALVEQSLEKHQNGLIFEFPKKDPEIVTPKTIVQLMNFDGGLAAIRTAHSYPNEKRVVITETMVERGET